MKARTEFCHGMLLVTLTSFLVLMLIPEYAFSSALDDGDVWQQISERAIQIPVLRPEYIPEVFTEPLQLGYVDVDKFALDYRSGDKRLDIVAGSFNLPGGGQVEEISFRGARASLIRYPTRDGLEETTLMWWESGGPYRLGPPPYPRKGVTPYALSLRGLPVDELLKIANSLIDVRGQKTPGKLPRTGEPEHLPTAIALGLLIVGSGLLLTHRKSKGC